MIIHCTQKLLKELKVLPLEGTPNPDSFGSWHANMFYVDRRKCVLITHDLSLYALFIPALKKDDFQSFPMVFGQYLFKNLLHEGLPPQQIERVLAGLNTVSYEKTNNRSVLGSMNDQRLMIEIQVQDSEGLINTDLDELNHQLNRNILSAIKYRYPIDVFKEELQKISTSAK